LADLGAARRALLHRRVAEALEQGASATAMAVLAYHYVQAGDQEKAVSYLQAAGDAALARHANAEASSAYREVVARLEALGRTLEAARWREHLGKVLFLLTEYDEALTALEGACMTYRQAGDLEGELRTLAQVGRTHRWRGTAAEGLAHLLPLRTRFSTLDASQGAAAFYIALAYLYTGTDQFSEMFEAAEQATKLARAVGEEQLLLVAQDRCGAALWMLGRLEEARAVLTSEVIPVGETSGNLSILIGALTNLGAVYYSLGEYHQGLAQFERALTLAEQLGARAQMAHVTFWHGLTAFSLGDWKQARADYERAARLVASADRSRISSYPTYGLGLRELVEGQEAARGVLEEAVLLAERDRDLSALCWLQGILAEADLLAGCAEAAQTRLAPLLEWIRPVVSYRKDTLPLLAWAELEVGEVAQAEARLGEVIALAREEGMRPLLADALRVQGLAWIKAHRWEAAEASLEEALALCRSMPYPYHEAKTLYVFGLLSQAKGDQEQARERLEAALTILHRLGERLYASRVEQWLAMQKDEA